MEDVIFTKVPNEMLSIVMPGRLSCVVSLRDCVLKPGPDSQIFLVADKPGVTIGPLQGNEVMYLQGMNLAFE